MKNNRIYLSQQNEVWLFCFFLVTFLVIGIFYYLSVKDNHLLQNLLKSYNSNVNKKKYIRTFIENTDSPTPKFSKKEIRFLGKKNQDGLGKITQGRGFLSPSSKRFLKINLNSNMQTSKSKKQNHHFTLEKIITNFQNKNKIIQHKKKMFTYDPNNITKKNSINRKKKFYLKFLFT